MELDPYTLFDRGRVALGVYAQHGRAASCWVLQAFDDLQGGRLPGAVGAQDAEDLTSVHGEGDVVNGGQ